jgi:hypothetical protein
MCNGSLKAKIQDYSYRKINKVINIINIIIVGIADYEDDHDHD